MANAEQALASVNAASSTARGLFTGFMLLTGYIVVILASTDDLQLFLYTPIKLPFFNIDVDIREFYKIIPWLYLIIHVNMLMIFAFLTEKINHLETQSQPLTFEQRQGLMKRQHVLIFTQYLSKQNTETLGTIIAMIVWLSVAFIPLLLLLWVQLDFLPAQEEGIIKGQRLAVAVDVYFILYFWNKILQKRRRSQLPVNWELPLWRRYNFGGYVLIFAALTCLFVSLCIIVIPFSPWDKTLSNNDPESLTRIHYFKQINALVEFSEGELKLYREGELKQAREEKLKQARSAMGFNNTLRAKFFSITPFKQWLALENEVITENEITAELHNHLIRLQNGEVNNFEKIYDQVIGYRAKKGSNLRFANLSKAILIKADLSGASLLGANLSGATLLGANLSKAKLPRVNLEDAQLQGANLSNAQLQGARLSSAMLVGANLVHAQLQGALLYITNLMGADLSQAHLQGVNLSKTMLVGADLTWVNLQGARLSKVNMTAANLSKATLGAAQIDGVILDVAGMDIESDFLTKFENILVYKDIKKS